MPSHMLCYANPTRQPVHKNPSEFIINPPFKKLSAPLQSYIALKQVIASAHLYTLIFYVLPSITA